MPDSRSDTELLLASGRGDRAAFEALYLRLVRPLFNFFHRLCWNPALAEDCTQEVFLRLWKASPRWRPEARVTTYVFTVAQHYWINEREREKHRPTATAVEASAEAPGRDPGPDGRAQTHEEALLVRRAVDALPEHERIVVLLSEFQGFKYREIAEILEIPVGTVKSRMSEAVRRLRERLDGSKG